MNGNIEKNEMIKPHGGQLVNRVVTAEEAAQWKNRAAELPRLQLDFRQLTDLYLLGVGAFSPIEGFQGSEELWSVARDFRLASGLIWSIPLLLLVGEEAQGWKEGSPVLLLNEESQPVGVLHLEEKFRPEALGIEPLFFDRVFFCKLCDGMATPKTCAHGEDAHVELSGTEVRAMLQKGILPPAEFSRKEVAQILVDSMKTPSNGSGPNSNRSSL